MIRLGVAISAVLALSLPFHVAEPSSQQGCKPLQEPGKVPALGVLVDSAALGALLPAPEPGGPAEVMITVVTGSKPRANLADATVTHTMGTETVKHVLASLKPGSRAATPAFRLHVVFGQPASLSVEPSVLCGPVMVGPPPPPITYRTTTVQPAGSPPPTPQRPRSVTPRIRIGENGEVLDVNLGSGTGISDLDREMRQSMRGVRYQPARLDGRPVEVWLSGTKVEIVR